MSRRRLTLAPAIIQVSTAPADSSEIGDAAGVGEGSTPKMPSAPSECASDHVVLNLADDEAYHDCIMAGYSSKEARDYILDKMKFSSLSDERFVENFWSEVGFPKVTRWWETERSSVGRQPEHDQRASSAPSSVVTTKF